jgi:hypothetical protein
MTGGISAKPDDTLRLLSMCGVIAPILFTVVIAILAFLRPTYSQVSQTISELGSPGAPNAIIQDANFLVTGLLITDFAFALRRGIPAVRSSRGPALVGVLGMVSFVLPAFFPISAGESQNQQQMSFTQLQVLRDSSLSLWQLLSSQVD